MSTKVSFDVTATNMTARVLQYNTTDCSGEPSVDPAIDDEMLRSDACVGRVKASTNFPFGDQSGGSNGGSSLSGAALAVIAVVAASFALST